MNRFVFLLLFLSLMSFGQDKEKSCDVLKKINTLMQREHFSPKPVDDSLSAYVFEKLLDELDADKNIFLKSEYESLSKHKFKFDDYLISNDCSFFEEFASTYKKALERSRAAIKKIQSEKLDYDSKDTVRFTKKHFSFYVTEADVHKVYTKRMKFDILEDIAKTSKNLDSIKANFDAIEKVSRAKIFEVALCKMNSRLEVKDGIEDNIRSNFYSIFTTYFDPHSSYFSYDSKSSFISMLSTDNLSLGLYVSLNENEELIVQEIVPGGPAAFAEVIEKGDQVLKVASGNNEEYLVSCASLETISTLIFSDSHKEITLSLRKKNGKQYEVTLQKKIMKADNNSVYSYITSIKNNRIGYINIPSFYTDFKGQTVQGTADDVAKEILKLKKDNIQGLIIDLQNNGGGSMEEAIRLSGMFIDAGPISVMLNNRKGQKVVRDSNRGTLYNGPLVILVNGNSASASEFFSSAMQDYNRALIIGTPTLGKATMQQILPIDPRSEQDFVKLTVEKFYRVTGKSIQKKGVVPDIIIPTLYDGVISREKNYKTALENDSISVKAKFKPYSKTIFEKLISTSKNRVNSDDYLKKIAEINAKIDTIYNSQKTPYLLNMENVFNDIHSIDATYNEIIALAETPLPFKIANTSYEDEVLAYDEFRKSINDFRIKELQNNAFALEGINIISDYYTQNN